MNQFLIKNYINLYIDPHYYEDNPNPEFFHHFRTCE